MRCRFCKSDLQHTMLDLGFAPPSNALLTKEDLQKSEITYPLKVKVCDTCWLVQTEDFVAPKELFNQDYPYFSSTSKSYLRHAADYAQEAIKKFNLNHDSHVVEIGSNDGYMLKNFRGIPCLGIEPTAAVARAARQLGIPVREEFFSERVARTILQADLIIGNNVYAHVPNLMDFTFGLKQALRGGGTITLEFPHLLRLLKELQFDTIYHEHFSYLSLQIACSMFESTGLRVFDVKELPIHGGSLRIYGCHRDDPRVTTQAVTDLVQKERDQGLFNLSTFTHFQRRVDAIKDDLLAFLIEAKKLGSNIFGFGAAAKGNSLLNYAGVKSDLLPFICDDTAAKQGKFMPGSHIPIVPKITVEQGGWDYMLVLPWNFLDEIKTRNADLIAQGTRCVTAIPKMKVHYESSNQTTDQFERADRA